MTKQILFVLLIASTNCFSQYYKSYDWSEKPKLHTITADEQKEHSIGILKKNIVEYTTAALSSDLKAYETFHTITRVNDEKGIGQHNTVYIPMYDVKNVIDTLEIARIKYPGSQNSLDALCKRFNIDNSKREKHNALIDCHLLKEIYFNLLDQKELKLNLESSGVINSKFNSNARKNNNISRKIIKLSDDELELHKKYLQSQLPKNNYNWLFFLSLYIFSKLIFFSILISFIPACLNK